MSASMETALFPRMRLRPGEVEELHNANHRLTDARRIGLGALRGIRNALMKGKHTLAGEIARYGIQAMEDTARGNTLLRQIDRELAESLGQTEALRAELIEAHARIERQRDLLVRAQEELSRRKGAA